MEKEIETPSETSLENKRLSRFDIEILSDIYAKDLNLEDSSNSKRQEGKGKEIKILYDKTPRKCEIYISSREIEKISDGWMKYTKNLTTHPRKFHHWVIIAFFEGDSSNFLLELGLTKEKENPNEIDSKAINEINETESTNSDRNQTTEILDTADKKENLLNYFIIFIFCYIMNFFGYSKVNRNIVNDDITDKNVDTSKWKPTNKNNNRRNTLSNYNSNKKTSPKNLMSNHRRNHRRNSLNVVGETGKPDETKYICSKVYRYTQKFDKTFSKRKIYLNHIQISPIELLNSCKNHLMNGTKYHLIRNNCQKWVKCFLKHHKIQYKDTLNRNGMLFVNKSPQGVIAKVISK